jgi:outer membrane protein assembly factor BamB
MGHYATGEVLEIYGFQWFLWLMLTFAVMLLGFLGWWMFSRRVPRSFRWAALAVFLIGVVTVTSLQPLTLRAVVAMLGVPLVFAAWILWLAAVRGRYPGLLAIQAVLWAFLALVRIDGLTGNGRPILRWFWTQTSEQLFLAGVAQHHQSPTTLPSAALVLRPGDWPAFRGDNRDGVVRGTNLALDWTATPPRLLWKQRVGPAWSSLTIVDGRLFTQEQIGDSEAIICVSADTGEQLWIHQNAGRFYEGMSGPGPRATPTFDAGRLYALGANGQLDCLDAATGQLIWSRNVRDDSHADRPMWGFASSPLVSAGLVIVFGGGEKAAEQKSLLAYRAATGELAWTAAAGKISYSSPQLSTLAGQLQVLLYSDTGLTGFDASSGTIIWHHDLPASMGLPPAIQPHCLDDSRIAVAAGDLGTTLVGAKRTDQRWSTERVWLTTRMKPAFNDFVVHEGFIYGFDGRNLCCLDAATGTRQWRGEAYGAGQVLLLPDQGLLLVSAEAGEAVLLRANPKRPEELTRFPAVTGKTWNHPTIAHGRLYIRSDAEMACYELPEKR